jgi:hypothetical protein
MRVEKDEQVRNAVMAVFAIVSLRLAGIGSCTPPMSCVGLSSKQTSAAQMIRDRISRPGRAGIWRLSTPTRW